MNRRFLIPTVSAIGSIVGCGSSSMEEVWDATTIDYAGQIQEAPFVLDEGSYYGVEFKIAVDFQFRLHDDGRALLINTLNRIQTIDDETQLYTFTGIDVGLWSTTEAGIDVNTGGSILSCTKDPEVLTCSEDDLTIEFEKG
jgi:hypothetical protein